MLSSIHYENYDVFTHKVDTDIITSATRIITAVDENPFIDLEYRSFDNQTVLGYAKLVYIGSEPSILIVETNKDAALASVYRTQLFFAAIIVDQCLNWADQPIFFQNITKPIAQLVAYSEQTASGDLSQRIESTRQDEIGKLMTAFNKMTDNLREMISLINDTVHNASAASQELSAHQKKTQPQLKRLFPRSRTMPKPRKRFYSITEKMAMQAQNVDQLSHKGSQQMIASDQVMMEILESSKASQEKSLNWSRL